MAAKQQETKVTTADPAALGLFGLAIVTLVASSSKLGWSGPQTAGIWPWAIFLGACAQIFAAIADGKRNNMFGMTAFGAFGFFWLAVAMTWMIKSGFFGADIAAKLDITQLGFAFVGYFIFTAYMTIASMETNKTLFIIFVLIDFLFIGLSLDSLGINHAAGKTIAGISEFTLSMFSFYASAAVMLNGHFGRSVLPLGRPFGIFVKTKRA
jgi:succinate-acetate transporter protein